MVGSERTDWVAWHAAYESAESSLSRRREIVQARLAETLGALGAPARLISLCAGDGRDVIEIRRRVGPSWTGRAVLVELDPRLARRARDAARGLDGVEVRCADAADRSSIADVVPVDVLMLCGVFGNVEPTDVERIVGRCTTLLDDGGYIIWTRGGGEPDRRGEVRAVFGESGFDEVSFDGAPERYGVGVSRLRSRPPAMWQRGVPLFQFVR